MYLGEVLERLIERGVTEIPKDVENALVLAHRKERKKTAKSQLSLILKNVELARKNRVPICQDTGTPVFYVRVGRRCDHVFDIEHELRNAVRNCTRKSILRPNIVEPLSRANSQDNSGVGMPIVHYELFDGDHIEITYAPKGAGTENFSTLWMMRPGTGTKEIEGKVLDRVIEMGGRPCPPYVLGIGLGGTSERCLEIARKASLREIGRKSEDRKLAALESSLLSKINKTGIGPMGLGGDTTCLAVNMGASACHTATMPVALSVSCWADRRSRVFLRRHGHSWVD